MKKIIIIVFLNFSLLVSAQGVTFSPTSGCAGDIITISGGSNISNNQILGVLIGGVTAAFTYTGGSVISAVVPKVLGLNTSTTITITRTDGWGFPIANLYAYGFTNTSALHAGAIVGPSTVCQSSNTVIYSVPVIANATSYQWTLPSGATGTSTTNSISVVYGLSATSGNITVKGNDSCGGGDPSTIAITVNNNSPSSAGAITSSSQSTTRCQRQNETFSVPPIAGATSYEWTLPSGATGTSTTNSINIHYGDTAVSGNITVKGINSCGTGIASTLAILLELLPSPPGTITGPTIVCNGQNTVVYSVPLVENATSYRWTLPNGVNQISGGYTNSITVDYGLTAVSGNITVQGKNRCGALGPTSTLAITVNPLPSSAGVITGVSTVCRSQNAVIYSVPVIANATSYQWTLPTGATGTSTTNSITVDYGLSASSGNITVKGVNSCGVGISSTLFININYLPFGINSISGVTTVCQGQNAIVYSANSSYATSYQWTLPSGATGTSTTSSISVNYGTTAVSGNITVKGINSCGAGSISTLAITVNPLPSNAGTITGVAIVTPGQNAVVYSIPPIPNASSYVWTLPSGATTTNYTNTISVNYGAAAVSGNITVKGLNNCGSGLASTLPITVAGTISGVSTICGIQNAVLYTIPLIANATSYQWTLPSGATGTSSTFYISVNYGSAAVSGNISVKVVKSSGVEVISTLPITVNTPSSPGTITGPTTHCAAVYGGQVSYSILPIEGATSYQWTLPSGAYVWGSKTSNAISVEYAGNAVSGNVTVRGVNGCGAGVASTLAVSVWKPLNSTGISGSTTVCQGQNSVVYTTPPVLGAFSYEWTLPSGATGTSTTNSISVNYGTTAVSGNIIVKGINACGSGLASTLAITIPVPSNAGVITGSATVCQGQNAVLYSVPAIANATSYQWTLPSGASGTSTTNSITVDYGLAAVSGNISVKGVNPCGAGVASVFAVNVINCSLPSNNFKLEVTDPTCQTKANGKLKITATASYNYTATMDGVNYTFTNNILDIANLAPKTYTICIKVPALNNYTQCFEFTVKSAPGLTAKTRMDTKGNKTTANVSIESGTAPYTVEINGKTIDVTFENQLNISVQNGDLLEIKTSVACEGKIRERVSLSNELMAYPNPTSNFVELFIPNTFQKKYVMIQMVDNSGKSVVNSEFKVINNSVIIPMETLSEGLYIINVQLETLQTIKIIKK